jgi:hypothetical protein
MAAAQAAKFRELSAAIAPEAVREIVNECSRAFGADRHRRTAAELAGAIQKHVDALPKSDRAVGPMRISAAVWRETGSVLAEAAKTDVDDESALDSSDSLEAAFIALLVSCVFAVVASDITTDAFPGAAGVRTQTDLADELTGKLEQAKEFAPRLCKTACRAAVVEAAVSVQPPNAMLDRVSIAETVFAFGAEDVSESSSDGGSSGWKSDGDDGGESTSGAAAAPDADDDDDGALPAVPESAA